MSMSSSSSGTSHHTPGYGEASSSRTPAQQQPSVEDESDNDDPVAIHSRDRDLLSADPLDDDDESNR